MDYTVIIPVYNEEEIIANTIDKIHEFLKKQHKSFEIIITNDGSKDNTVKITNEKIKYYPELRIVSNPINLGRGAALTNAFKQGRGDIQVYVDADLAIDLELFPKLMNAIQEQGADIAVASKHMKDSEVEYPLLRRLFSKGYSLLTRVLLNSDVKDYQCGFKAFKKGTLIKVLPHIKEQAWNWDTEIIVKSQWLGFKVVELPAKVVNIYGRESKVNLLKDVRKMGEGLYRIWKQKKNFRK